MIITYRFLHDNAAACSPHGSTFSAAQLKVLGVRYPLRKGWMRRVVGKTLTEEQAEQFINARLILNYNDKHHIRQNSTPRKREYSQVSAEFLAAMDKTKQHDRTTG